MDKNAVDLSILLGMVLICYSSGAAIEAEDKELKRPTRCTKVECDLTKALSYCGPIEKQCNPGHEEAPYGKCEQENKRCCRTACGGPGSYCFSEQSPCLPGHLAVSGKCPVVGFRCCSPNYPNSAAVAK